MLQHSSAGCPSSSQQLSQQCPENPGNSPALPSVPAAFDKTRSIFACHKPSEFAAPKGRLPSLQKLSATKYGTPLLSVGSQWVRSEPSPSLQRQLARHTVRRQGRVFCQQQQRASCLSLELFFAEDNALVAWELTQRRCLHSHGTLPWQL